MNSSNNKGVSQLSSRNNYPALEDYVSCQNYNFITQFFHSIRYRHLKNFIQSVLLNSSSRQTFQSSGLAQSASMDLFEIGCGYGKSLDVVSNVQNYTGIDIDPQFAAFCQQKFTNPNYQFLHADIRDFVKGIKTIPFQPSAIIALECFEHIQERDVPDIIHWLASLKCPVFISVPNEVGPALLFKNIGSALMGYVRHKEYSWLETWYAATFQMERLPLHQTGHIGFDYRWLASIIQQNFHIVKVGTSPFDFIPRFLSPSIYFYCTPRSKS